MDDTPRTTYRILLIEDDAADARLVTRFLSGHSDQVQAFDVQHVWRLDEALARLKEHDFDVVVCDVHLPDAAGPEVIAALVAADADLPVVALTGQDDAALGLASIEAGAEGYLTKDRVDALGLRRALVHTFARVRERRRLQLSIARAHRDELEALNAALRAEARRRADASRRVDAINRELERSNRALQEFAQVASHDLKSPLAAVARLVDWLVDDLGPTADETSKANLAQLRRRVSRMVQLLDDVLAWARLGSRETPREAVDVGALVRQLWGGLDGRERFELRVEGPLPTLVTHRAPLAMVFRNLLSNAIKHHDKPAGRVSIGYRRGAQGHVFEVRDDGPGIPLALHERVFKLFGVGRTDKPGSGLGLAMVSRAVAEMGGTIELSKETGRGARFTVTWPDDATS